MGVDDHADVLMISYSSTDYVGHDFGTNAKELQDTYILLDMELARLFEVLDAQRAMAHIPFSSLQTTVLLLCLII